MSIFQLTEAHHQALDSWNQLTTSLENIKGNSSVETEATVMSLLAQNIEFSFEQQGIFKELFQEIVQHEHHQERQAVLERSNLAAGIKTTSAEQALQAISDRLGSELDLKKLRIIYGINDGRNQSVIYGGLASGRFRDSDNISDAQAAAILDAIDAPVSESVPAANLKTGNLPNARIQIIYDEQLLLRQERNGRNSENQLCQEQVQEQDHQPVEPVKVPVAVEVTAKLVPNEGDPWVPDEEFDREIDKLFHDPYDDPLYNPSDDTILKPLLSQENERTNLVSVDQEDFQDFIEPVQVEPEQPKINEQVYSEQADGDRIAPPIDFPIGADSDIDEDAYYEQLIQTKEARRLYDLERSSEHTTTISNDQASLNSSQQQLNQSELDAQDLSFMAVFKNWTIKDVRQIYENTETITVGTTFDLLSVAYRKQHGLDRDFDLDKLSDQTSSLTVRQFVRQEFQVDLEQVTPDYEPFSVKEYEQLCQQEEEETNEKTGYSFSSDRSDNSDAWGLDSLAKTEPSRLINNDRPDLHPIEQEFIALYKDWTLQEIRQAFESAQEYKSVLVGLISSDCGTVLDVVASAYGKKHHPDLEFDFTELPPHALDAKVSEFVRQEFQVDLDQVRSASSLINGGCSVEEYHQRCQEERNNSTILGSESAPINAQSNNSIDPIDYDFDRVAQTLEELFITADQQNTEESSQGQHEPPQNVINTVAALERGETTESSQQFSIDLDSEGEVDKQPPEQGISQTKIELEPPPAPDQSDSGTIDPSSANVINWLESGLWASDPETTARLMSWAEWNKGNDGLVQPTSVLSPAALAVAHMPESNSKQFAQAVIEDIQNQPVQQSQQQPERQSEQRSSPLEPEQRSLSPLAAVLDRAAHRVVGQAVQWLDNGLVAAERGLEKVGRWMSSRAEAARNHNAAEIAYKLFDRGFNRTEETQYQHQGFQVEKIANEKNGGVFILRDAQTGSDLLKFRTEQRSHSDPKIEVLAKARAGIPSETIQRLTTLESNLSSVRGSDRGEEQRSQNVERFAQVAQLVNEFGSTRNSHYVVDSGRTEAGEDWLCVTAKGSRGVIYEQTGSEVRENLQLWDFRRANSAYATVETPVTASQQANDQER